MPYLSIAILSGPMPNAKPEYSSGSNPAISSTFGCTMPEPRISIQPERLHTLHPAPSHLKHEISTSTLGSVKVRDVMCVNAPAGRSEEHTSELQSRFDLVCRLLL